MDGLTVDTDLRWTLLRRLVSTGEAGEAEIDAELKADPTAAGQRNAAGARAAIPTSEAKEAAWERIVGGDLANAEFRSVLVGFTEPLQADLYRPFLDRYFARLAPAWENWTGEFAQSFAEIAYPSHLVEEATLERTDAYIAENSPAPALRRLLIEGRAGVERALRARATDIAAGAEG